MVKTEVYNKQEDTNAAILISSKSQDSSIHINEGKIDFQFAFKKKIQTKTSL